MTTPLRIGVIGCGIMGNNHARVAAEADSLTLAAVADVRAEAAQKVGNEHGAANVYTSADALLADGDVDAVVIAMPTNLRAPIAEAAFASGKHVLLEKPVAMNADELRRLISARGNRVGAVCSCRYRYFDAARAATDVVASGKLGPLRIVRFRGLRQDGGPRASEPPAWRVSHALNGGGIFVNWGSYDLDYVLGIVGWKVRPRRVSAMCWPASPRPMRVAQGSDAETHAMALIQCDDNIALSFERAEFTSLATEEAWQITGENASLRLDMLAKKTGQTIYLDEAHDDGPLTTSTVYEAKEIDHWLAHRGPLEDLAEAVATGRPPLTTFENALLMQQITDAVYESARTGKTVEID